MTGVRRVRERSASRRRSRHHAWLFLNPLKPKVPALFRHTIRWKNWDQRKEPFGLTVYIANVTRFQLVSKFSPLRILTIADAERYFSPERIASFRSKIHTDEDAISLYTFNIELSQSLYTPLSILEVCLRNSVHMQMVRKFGQLDWYESIGKVKALRPLVSRVNQAKKSGAVTSTQKESIASGKVVAEFNFGFWTSLFEQPYELELWSNLKHCFPHLEKSKRKRTTIDGALQPIRLLRNRVYHYEAICWNLTRLNETHLAINDLILWMDPTLQTWLTQVDTFPAVLAQVRYRVSALNIILP